MRITALLQKMNELASQADNATVIDIDLMLDYTRVLYSDLLEWRKNVVTPHFPEPEPPMDAVGKTELASVEAIDPEPEILNGHTSESPKIVMPLSSPGSPVVQQTSVQFAAPEIGEIPETAPVAPQPEVPKEPTLEEYLARQRALGKVSEEPEDGDADADGGTSPGARPATAPPPVAIAGVEFPMPAVTPLPAPPPQPRDIRTMIGINDKYQIMSELFGNDKAAYEQALDVINRAESEQAAFNWLRERLWVTEDHSDAAMIFFDVVRRFKNA